MASAMDIRLKQRVVIEFLTAEGFSPIESHTRIKAVDGESCSGVSTVTRRARRSKEEIRSESNMRDQPHTGQPLSISIS